VINIVDKKLEKYYNFIVADLIKGLVWDDIMDHMFIVDGERINSCNLWSDPFYKFLVKKYGITPLDHQYITERLKDYLDKYYPYRCDV
jgi:hypothetical protein